MSPSVALRYYMYVSDAKVDMLLSQIEPAAKRKLAKEFSVGIKIFGAKHTSERLEGEDRICRLEAVVNYLTDHGEVGPLEDPRRFFGGEIDMRWGLYDPARDGLVFFGGSNDNAIIGLGGSTHHLIGAAPAPETTIPRSQTVALLRALRAAATREETHSELEGWPDERSALEAVGTAVSHAGGPPARLEFVAKRLLSGPDPARFANERKLVVLGSPLYVAMVD